MIRFRDRLAYDTTHITTGRPYEYIRASSYIIVCIRSPRPYAFSASRVTWFERDRNQSRPPSPYRTGMYRTLAPALFPPPQPASRRRRTKKAHLTVFCTTQACIYRTRTSFKYDQVTLSPTAETTDQARKVSLAVV
jgi:hypothetical protein